KLDPGTMRQSAIDVIIPAPRDRSWQLDCWRRGTLPQFRKISFLRVRHTISQLCGQERLHVPCAQRLSTRHMDRRAPDVLPRRDHPLFSGNPAGRAGFRRQTPFRTEQQKHDACDQGAHGDRQQADGKTAGRILDRAHHEGAQEATEITH
ncbi:MAG: hypothetical protein QOF90_3486, partial [Acetobacteraceae bacterium]|nr:hypothetical protein [Acetobacteraceae bacterium]